MILFILVCGILTLASWTGLSRLFKKAGYQAWQAFVPGYNLWIWLKITGAPSYWILLLLVPIINVFIFSYMHIDMVRSFGKNGLGDYAMSILIPFIFFPFLGFSEEITYLGQANTFPKEVKTKSREWTEAIVFAVVAATLIRWLIMEAFVIPTPSMENSLLVGDYLFVSKLNYGARTPKTILQLPLTHQTIWFTNIPSYLDWIELPQYRLPGLSKVKRNDVVVFNYPYEFNYPVDLKTNYIKRCVAVSGDVLEIKNRNVYVNDKEMPLPPKAQFNYYIEFKPNRISNYNFTFLLNKFGKNAEQDVTQVFPQGFVVSLEPSQAKQAKQLDFVQGISLDSPDERKPVLYPFNKKFNWTPENYGPIWIPQKGARIEVNADNLILYGTVIEKYEHHKNVLIKDNKLFINGKEIKNYEFRQNYYFMMGDNRENSADSRYWGFVPEDHVVGKALFIWLSMDKYQTSLIKKIRWNRLFNIIK